ncbi:MULTISPECIES: hypothetical protein [Paraburkholderia]|uniref:hypothetical protein n=1 Tax=Paraburkholderia TaxID=1822464 RepID=UPI00224ECB99|nr:MULTISPECIES: hypothetical protein [Paraburkholderia]MCX4176500.1 hypothetical protein [Paraburkholderia madseniana]MDQ6464492.1 hypothetical protein [Paraburkholderia madseniana]
MDCPLGDVIIAIGASVYLLRAVSKPLNTAVDDANQIAAGKLGNQIAVHAGGADLAREHA